MYSETARPFLIAENRRYANIVKRAHERTKRALDIGVCSALSACFALAIMVNYPTNLGVTVWAAISVGITLSSVWSALGHTFRADYYHGLHMQQAEMLYSNEAEHARIITDVFTEEET